MTDTDGRSVNAGARMDATGIPATEASAQDVRLEVAVRGDVELLAALMAPRDVWFNLGYCHPPSTFLLSLSMRHGMQALVIRTGAAPVGLFLVYGPYAPGHALEFDGAISDAGMRRRGLALRSMHLFLDFMFPHRCHRLDAVIHEENAPSRALLRRVGFHERRGPLLPGRHGGAPRHTVRAWREAPVPGAS